MICICLIKNIKSINVLDNTTNIIRYFVGNGELYIATNINKRFVLNKKRKDFFSQKISKAVL